MCVHGPVNYRPHLSSWGWDGYPGEAFVQIGTYRFVVPAPSTYQEITRVETHLVRTIPFEWVRECVASRLSRANISVGSCGGGV